MGWLRLAGSLKSSVSFANEPYIRDYILQKRPIIWRNLLIVATPYVSNAIHQAMLRVCTDYPNLSSATRLILCVRLPLFVSILTHKNLVHSPDLSNAIYQADWPYCACVWRLCNFVRYKWTFLMRWLRWIGSLKTWVSFAKETYKRDLLRVCVKITQLR